MKKIFFKIHEKHIKGREIPQFDLGDTVYMKDQHYIRPFVPKYIGHFKIQKKLRSRNYVIKDVNYDKLIVRHANKLLKLNDSIEINDNENNNSVSMKQSFDTKHS